MSATSSRTSNNDNNSSASYRVNYSDYVADITGSPKTTRKLPTAGVGHHINPLHNPFPNRPNQQQTQQTGVMPQYGGGADKCARCHKNVYLAEKKVGAGRSFHSSCFCCLICKRKLDSTALSEHKGEIYCKGCYTKQFGAHGLISGVAVSTETAGSRESRTRRSSYGNDLDAPYMAYQATRQRANSSENLVHDQYPSNNSRRNDIYSEQNSSFQKYQRPPSPSSGISRSDSYTNRPSSPSGFSKGVDPNAGKQACQTGFSRTDSSSNRPPSPSGFSRGVDTNKQASSIGFSRLDSNTNRPPSPSGFSRGVDTNANRNQYSYNERYSEKSETSSYNKGTSAMVDIPVITETKRTSSTIGRYESPIEPQRTTQRSRSPSITSNDSYQRQSSNDRQLNFTDNYGRSNISDDNINRKYSNDNTIRTNSYESSQTTRTYNRSPSNSNTFDRDQNRSRDSSPSTSNIPYRPSSPTTGYTTSTTTTTRNSSSTYRADTASPSSTNVPKYDYGYQRTPSNSNITERRSPSPKPTDRTSSALNDFVKSTNITQDRASTGDKFSALSALVQNAKQKSTRNDDDDDEFN